MAMSIYEIVATSREQSPFTVIEVTKIVAGEDAPENEIFTFTITENGVPLANAPFGLCLVVLYNIGVCKKLKNPHFCSCNLF